MGNTPLLADPLLENDLSLGEDGVDVAGGKRGVPPDVIGSIALHQRAARRHRLLHVHDGWERLVVDYDQLGCIVCEVSILSDHHRDRLAGVGDLVCRDGELLGHLLLVGDKGVADRQRPEDDAFEVGGGEHRHDPFRRSCPRRVDRADARVRVRAAHDRHVRHVHEVDVVDEVAVPGDELGILATLDAGPDHGGDSHRPVLHRSSGGSDQLTCRLSGAALHRLGRGSHRLPDVLVAGAAAEVALQSPLDLLVGGRRVLLQEIGGGHDETGSAEAALQAVLVPERLLHGVEGAVLGQPFDRRHLLPVCLDREDAARLHRLAVDRTVQAPHWLVSQAMWVPVSPATSRR